MSRPAHEALVARLRQRPELLDRLRRIHGRAGPPGDVAPVESTRWIATPLAVRPGLVLMAEGERGPPLNLEVPLPGVTKRRRVR